MKRLTFLLLASMFLFSCANKNQPAAQAETGTNPNEALIKQYFEHFNKHDWAKMAAMYTDTADFKDPSLGKGIVKQSREQTIKKYSELQQMFPDVKDSIVNIYPAGDKTIVVEFISTGTAPDKSKFELPICTIFTIENGLITKDYTYFDNF